MEENTAIAFFENQQVRREWFNSERRFSIVDIVSILTGSYQPSRYRTELKNQLMQIEGYTDLFGKIEKLKFLAKDGKKYLGDAANTKTLFRIIQSIPSPKAEPIKQWLASLGNQRIEESNDPELGMQRARNRAIQTYKNRGMSEQEIHQRLQSIDTRLEYTEELKQRGIKGIEYGILTNISYLWSGKHATEYKYHKGLMKNDNLRDHMTKTELILTSLSEEAGKEIIKSKAAKGFNQVQNALLEGSDIAKKTRENLEEKIGKSIVNTNNRLTKKQQILRKKAQYQEKSGYNKRIKRKILPQGQDSSKEIY